MSMLEFQSGVPEWSGGRRFFFGGQAAESLESGSGRNCTVAAHTSRPTAPGSNRVGRVTGLLSVQVLASLRQDCTGTFDIFRYLL